MNNNLRTVDNSTYSSDIIDTLSSTVSKVSSNSNYSINTICTTPATLQFAYRDTGETFKLDELTLGELYSYFTEDELKNIIEIVLERSTNENFKKEFISGVIKSRHFSEDFLIAYLDYVSEIEVRAFHAADLNSNKYSHVKLFYELKK